MRKPRAARIQLPMRDVSCGYHLEHTPGAGQTCRPYSMAGSEEGTDLRSGCFAVRSGSLSLQTQNVGARGPWWSAGQEIRRD